MEKPPMAQLPMVVLVDCLRVSSAGPWGPDYFPADPHPFLVMKYEELSRLAGFAVSPAIAVERKRHLTLAIPPDGQHLFWTGVEIIGQVQTVTYLDGKPVARCDRLGLVFSPPGNIQFAESSPAWSVGPDGAVTFVGAASDVIKRFRITPPSDTSIATMLAGAPAKVEPGSATPEKETFTIKKNLTPAQAAALEKWKALNAKRAARGLPELPLPRDLREE